MLEYLHVHLAAFVGNINLNTIAFGQTILTRKKKGAKTCLLTIK